MHPITKPVELITEILEVKIIATIINSVVKSVVGINLILYRAEKGRIAIIQDNHGPRKIMNESLNMISNSRNKFLNKSFQKIPSNQTP
jgi:hypothetical protein